MRTIVFNVRDTVGSDEQKRLLERLSQMPGVSRAAAIRPDAKHANVRRMCYVELSDDAQGDSICSAIDKLSEVEPGSTAEPETRGLL